MKSIWRSMMCAAALCGVGCDAADDGTATRVSRIEIMNLAVAQQVGAPALAAVFPSTQTRDRLIAEEPYVFTTSEFDGEGRLIRIEVTDRQQQDDPYRIITVEWVEDVVARIAVVDKRYFEDEPSAETVTDGL